MNTDNVTPRRLALFWAEAKKYIAKVLGGKQDKLSADQVANIAAVPGKLDKPEQRDIVILTSNYIEGRDKVGAYVLDVSALDATQGGQAFPLYEVISGHFTLDAPMVDDKTMSSDVIIKASEKKFIYNYKYKNTSRSSVVGRIDGLEHIFYEYFDTTKQGRYVSKLVTFIDDSYISPNIARIAEVEELVAGAKSILNAAYEDKFEEDVNNKYSLIRVDEYTILPSSYCFKGWIYQYSEGWRIVPDFESWAYGSGIWNKTWEEILNYFDEISFPLEDVGLVPGLASKDELQILQEQVNRIYADFAEYDKTDFPDVNFGTPTRAGAYIGANGQFVTASGYNVSNDIEVTRGNLYKLYVGNVVLPNGIAVFSKKVVSQTPSGEKVSYVPQFVSAGGATPKSGYLVFLATEDMTIVTSYPVSATKLEVSRYGVLASLCTQIDGLRKAVDLKSFADGYYAQMRVGLADNLTPRGESVAAEFKERIAGGGMSITDGSSKYEEIRGNSVVWNQLVASTGFFTSGAVAKDGDTYTFNGTTTSAYIVPNTNAYNLVAGHKYILLINASNVGSTIQARIHSGTSYITSPLINGIVFTSDSTGSATLFLRIWSTVSGASVTLKDDAFHLSDLTQMFGAGNEPSTYEEFLQRKPMVEDEYAYNEGEIVNNKVSEVKTTGVNLWDEEWVYEGTPTAYFQAKNFIKVVGGNTYHISNGSHNYRIYCYDENKTYLRQINWQTSHSFALADDVAYIKFIMFSSYGATYNNDIIVSLAEVPYKPYEEHTLDLSWIKEVKDDNGVTLFEDGMRSAGTAYDEAGAKKAVKRFGEVDLGSLNWETFYASSGVYSVSWQTLGGKPYGNLMCAKYANVGGASGDMDGYYLSEQNFVLFLPSHKGMSATELREYLAGVKLIYELTTPIEVEYEEKNMTVPVASGGMESAVALLPSTPLKAKIVYGMDAYQQIVASKNNIGNVAQLATADKSSLVAAINELAARIAALPSSTNITD